MSRILNHEQNTKKYAHLTKQGRGTQGGDKTALGHPGVAEGDP